MAASDERAPALTGDEIASTAAEETTNQIRWSLSSRPIHSVSSMLHDRAELKHALSGGCYQYGKRHSAEAVRVSRWFELRGCARVCGGFV